MKRPYGKCRFEGVFSSFICVLFVYSIILTQGCKFVLLTDSIRVAAKQWAIGHVSLYRTQITSECDSIVCFLFFYDMF